MLVPNGEETQIYSAIPKVFSDLLLYCSMHDALVTLIEAICL